MLVEDVAVSASDAQGLANADALAALFARLGYATNARLAQSVSAMGITNDTLRASIQRIERIANDDGISSLQVYLFELKSVTVDVTRRIVGAFRDRAGDYLLVLTKDYEQIDFVLVDRYTQADIGVTQETLPGMPARRTVRMQPRVLSVDRRKPTPVVVRTLRRFSFTEADTLAQFDKLRAAYDAAYWSEPHFNNRALFSDYYLTERLPEDAEWKSPEERLARRRPFHLLRELYSMQERPADLIERALVILGFTATRVRKRGKAVADDTAEEGGEPDYRLAAAGNDSAALGGEEEQPRSLALCLAYPWGRNLDGKDEERDPERGADNPGAVVVRLLDSGEAGWAIVTNGRIWRLYSATAHSRATNYYEIDLQDLLSQPATSWEEAFPYFWLFFRAAAFIPTTRREDGEERQASFLDTLRAGSERYARELEEKLKRRVFDEVFPHFASGFVTYARQHGMLPANLERLPDDARNQALVPFFAGTLTFLYRLLFVLYAESRDLLPVRETRDYAEQSLDHLKQEIAARAGKVDDDAPAKIRYAYTETSTTLYERLHVLFRAIDKGNAELNVPVYNGGLFITDPDDADTSAEAEVARFLETMKIPDRQLALGLDRLARDIDEKTHDLGFIDYKSLGVRQLGSMYEGLLEFKLRMSSQRMAIVHGKKAEEIVPYAEAKAQNLRILMEGTGAARRERTYEVGEVYLENDKRERKASGSYYTPDYIVKYIVEHTVGPVLSEKLEALRPAFRAAQQTLRAERDKRDALVKQRITPKNPEEEAYLKTRDAVNEAFFDLKALDPAMGSGHFLVEAVDYITDRMAEFLTAFPWNPVVYELAKTRNEITEEMERQGVMINTAKLTDLNLLKRHVLKRCIYGVDLNPMAVELAKVSLWLDCFTLGAPLSFLDHHMKVGNSLIGASVEEVEKSLTYRLWGSQFAGLLSATQMMRQVGDLSDVTAQEVAASKRAYRDASDLLAPFKRMLDVWLSEYFGNRGAKKTVDNYAQAIVDGDYSSANKEDRAAIAAALELAEDKRFFHWELEFPEVFYDAYRRKENGGFDAVVGNPPYDVYTSKGADQSYLSDMTYFENAPLFAIALGGQVNIYRLFIAKELAIVRQQASIGQIIPISILADRSTRTLRKTLLHSTRIVLVEAFPQKDDQRNRVFEDAKLSTCVLVLNRDSAVGPFIVRTHPGKHIDERSPAIVVTREDIEVVDAEEASIPIGQPATWKVMVTLYKKPYVARLATIATCTRGEVSLTFNRDDLTKNPLDAVMLKGVEISRYGVNEHLSQGEKQWLDEASFRAASPESQRIELVARHRVALQRITGVDDSRRVFGTIILPGVFLAESANSVSVTDSSYHVAYMAAFLNSRVIDWRFRATSTNNNVSSYEINGLPIRSITFTTPASERQANFEEGKRLYVASLVAGDVSDLLAFVVKRLSQEPEQSDVVHDLLAFLAEEMIRMNKEKRAEQKRYLDGLVTMLHIAPDRDGATGLDALTGKSKLADYPGDYQKGEPHLTYENLLDILSKNRGRLGVNLSDPGVVERLRREYAASLEVVLPLKERLARTDRLIDQIVYKLYGLTDDEIAIVEGR